MSNIEAIEKLRKEFLSPADEFTPVPFWFWNDNLTKKEIKRQINEFYAKGVMGFVIHPRIGIPKSIEYLSDRFMGLVQCAVAEASRLGMTVVLYDEGMYPSGSAHGMVVEGNPEYASRALKMLEYPCSGCKVVVAELCEGEELISAQAVQKISDAAIDPSATVILKAIGGKVEFDAASAENFSILLFVDTHSRGTIRGIHFGEDSRQPGAPKSADILNPFAVQKFIRLTHERYYECLSEYFGNTIKAIFTDEPSIMGRYPLSGLKPWSRDFLTWYMHEGNDEADLAALWFEVGTGTEEKRLKYRQAVSKRLELSYYKQISDWCTQHGIGLAGHPSESDEIGLLKHFHIPGQDLIFRYVAPEDEKAIKGKHSTMAKCSSDAARHAGKRRNVNECFGCCYRGDNSWDLPAGDMKWFMDWLFSRGVNMLMPHAFYYSIRGSGRAGERPPDVGPNNIWWPCYNTISAYIKRLSWLMTDSANAARTAVLCSEEGLPWEIVKPMYQRQIEFNYLETGILLSDSCSAGSGLLSVADQQYTLVLIQNPELMTEAVNKKLQEFIYSGGNVIIHNPDEKHIELMGYIELDEFVNIPEIIDRYIPPDVLLHPENRNLRVSHVVKDNLHFYLCVNEGEELIEGSLTLSVRGSAERWDAWKGSTDKMKVISTDDNCLKISMSLERRESIVFCVDPSKSPDVSFENEKNAPEIADIVELDKGWRINDRNGTAYDVHMLESWTIWDGMKHFSGTVTYENSFHIDSVKDIKAVWLELGRVCEIAQVYINEKKAGAKMWAPYRFNIMDFVNSGRNTLRIEVTNSAANKINKAELCSGLIGPVHIEMFK